MQISIYTHSIIWFSKQSNWFASQPIDNGHTIHIDFVLFTIWGAICNRAKLWPCLHCTNLLSGKSNITLVSYFYSIVWGIGKGMWNKRLCWKKVPWFSVSPIWDDVCWKFRIKPTKTYMGIAQSLFNYP